MAHIVQANVTIGDTENITDFLSLSISEVLHGHHKFRIKIPMHVLEYGNQSLTSSHELIGENFVAELMDKTGKTYLYNGIINHVHFSKNSPLEMSMVISGYSPTILLDDHRFCRTWLESSLDDIVNDLLSKYPLQGGSVVGPMYTEKIPYSVQYNETVFQYLSRMADCYGEWFYYNGEKIVFGALEPLEEETLKLGDDLYNYSFDVLGKPLKGIQKAYDYNKDETYESDYQYDKVKNLDPFSESVVGKSETMFAQDGNAIASPSFLSAPELEKNQEFHKAKRISQINTFSGTSSACNIHLGTVINAVGTHVLKVGKLSTHVDFELGKFTVISVHHHVGPDGDYSNNFTAIPEKLVHPPQSNYAVKPQPQKQIATVVDNKDPDKIGRIKIRFPWMSDDEETPYIRYATRHAAANNGMYFIPEIDDQVLVDFENGDPDCPIVTASLFHGKAKPDKWYNDDNNQKAIKTKSGNEILFDDTGGKETIKIFNPDQTNIITLTMDDGKSITIQSDGDINLHATDNIVMTATNIQMTASENYENTAKNMIKTCGEKIETSATETVTTISDKVDLTVGKDINVSTGKKVTYTTGDTFAITSSKDFKVDTIGSVKVSAMQNVKLGALLSAKLSGLTTKVTGIKTTVEGSASLKVTSKKTEVEGSAKMSVKGAATEVAGTATCKVSGAKTEVAGSAMLDLKGGVKATLGGGVVMIN